jgi:alpha-galactosidase
VVTPVVKHSMSRRFGSLGASWRHPQGWQAVVRTFTDGKQALVVLHAFAAAPLYVEIPFASGAVGNRRTVFRWRGGKN